MTLLYPSPCLHHNTPEHVSLLFRFPVVEFTPQVFYWIYLVTGYFTVLTWLLAVLAAGLDSWVKATTPGGNEYETLRPQSSTCYDDVSYQGSNICSSCEYVIGCLNLMVDVENEMYEESSF